jgi:hypothetical protein
MAQAEHTKAAEHHEAAAKSHRTAAEMHGKKNDNGALEHAAKGQAQSVDANKASTAAHGKSAAIAGKK